MRDDSFQRDLHPDFMAGQNRGDIGPNRDDALVAADLLKLLHTVLPDFDRDDLRRIPLLALGTRLQQGATYVDIQDPARRPFTATADMYVGLGNLIVPKAEIDYRLWNRLVLPRDEQERRGAA